MNKTGRDNKGRFIKGFKHMEISKKKITEGLKGRKCSKETREKIRLSNLGKKRSEEAKIKNRIAHLGRPAWNKGKKLPNMSGEKHPNWKGGRPLSICLNCNNKFQSKISKLNRKSKFCSIKCKAKWQSLYQKLGNNPNWQGGKTDVSKLIRTTTKYLEWRQDVFIRDNFTCQECSQIGGKLNAHHIKTFKQLIQEAKEYMPLLDWYEACILYTPLWDVNNGITYCEKCHKNKYNKEKKI